MLPSRCLPSFACCAISLCLSQATFGQAVPPAPANPQDEPIVLSPFTVSTDKDRGYASSNSMGGSRIAIPIGDIPSSVIVLNEQLLRDRAALDSIEALTFVSGVQRGADLNPGQEQFSLRGYAIAGVSLRDGLPEPFAAADQPFDESSSYERIEIIKGPAGTLYGAQSLGGIVNKVSKWPMFRRKTLVELTAESDERLYRAMLDTTGPLTDRLAYRVVLSARTGERFYNENDAPNDFYNASGALTYLLGKRGEAGKLWLRGQHLDITLDREQGWQFITGYLAPGSSSLVTDPKFPLDVRANTVPEDDVSEAQIYGLEAGFEKPFKLFDGDWTLRLIGRKSDGKGDKVPSYAQGRPIPVDDTGAIVRYTNSGGVLANGDNRYIAADDPRVADWRAAITLRDFRGYNEAAGGFMDLVGDFNTGPLAHKLVLSAATTVTESERAFFFWAAQNPANTTAVPNSYSAVAPPPSSLTASSIQSSSTKQFNAFNGRAETNGYAYAFQDNIGLFDNRLILAIGARHDDTEITNDRFDPAQSLAQDRFVINPALRTVARSKADTYKYGVVAKPAAGLSIFAQHSETFTPITSLNGSGGKNPDQEGKNDEIGLKLELLDGRVVGTISRFEMELTNVLLQVVNPPELGGGFVLRPVGVQKTTGSELDLAIEPLPGLNLLVSYSDITSKDEQGRFFRGVPLDANYGIYSRYAFQEGRLKGLAIGASWKHNGTFAGDTGNTFFIPDNDQFDAFVAYDFGKWGVQLNVFNLTNDDSVLSSVTDQLVMRAHPRDFRLTVRYTF